MKESIPGVNRPLPQPFLLYRDEDVSGVSGPGVVAEGIRFSDGRVALRWCADGQPQSTVTWDSITDVACIHGHDGKTKVVWIVWNGYDYFEDKGIGGVA